MNNCGPVHNGMYMQGNNMMMPQQLHPGNMQMGMGNELPPTSSASQVRARLLIINVKKIYVKKNV